MTSCTLSTEPFDRDTTREPRKLGVDKATGLDRDEIKKAIFNHKNEIHQCYEKRFNKKSRPQGKVVLNFSIEKGGQVVSAEVNERASQLTDKKIHQCLIEKLKTWKFPDPPKGQVVEIIYPLFFNS